MAVLGLLSPPPPLDSRMPADERARLTADLELALVVMADDWKLPVEWLQDRQAQLRGFSDFYLLHMWRTYRQR